jgi:hydrogenase maturation protease
MNVPTSPKPIAFIGIGNTLTGDDGAGITAVERLQHQLSSDEKKYFLFSSLPGDFFAVADLLTYAQHFIFLDAVDGDIPGEIRTLSHHAPRTMPGSFHQSDIGTVMASLRRMKLCSPFPTWEVRGITITPPKKFTQQLSPVIDAAVDRLVDILVSEIRIGAAAMLR